MSKNYINHLVVALSVVSFLSSGNLKAEEKPKREIHPSSAARTADKGPRVTPEMLDQLEEQGYLPTNGTSNDEKPSPLARPALEKTAVDSRETHQKTKEEILKGYDDLKKADLAKQLRDLAEQLDGLLAEPTKHTSGALPVGRHSGSRAERVRRELNNHSEGSLNPRMVDPILNEKNGLASVGIKLGEISEEIQTVVDGFKAIASDAGIDGKRVPAQLTPGVSIEELLQPAVADTGATSAEGTLK